MELIDEFKLNELDVLLLENVCPASYDPRRIYASRCSPATEGEDKSLKYPTIFDRADIAILPRRTLRRRRL